MLHLASATDARWAQRAITNIDEILLDHAHLEKKAASSALQFIFRYPEHVVLHRPLSELAREELEHFERVLSVLESRGLAYRQLRPSPYPGKLRAVERKEEPLRLMDGLLCSGIIEARSCERMKLLAEALPEGALKDLYASLLASEARHHRLYYDLAASIFGEAEVRPRLAALAAHEAEILGTLPDEPRLHNP